MGENTLIDQGCFRSAKYFYESFRRGVIQPHNLKVVNFL